MDLAKKSERYSLITNVSAACMSALNDKSHQPIRFVHETTKQFIKIIRTLQFLLLVAVGITLASSNAIENEGKRLIKTSEAQPGEWMTEEEIIKLIRKKVTFVDITDIEYSENNPANVDVHAVPTTLRFNATVRSVINNLNSDRVVEFIEQFSSYHNRYYSSQTGRSSQLWLLSEVQSSVERYVGNASVFEVDHGYLQKSIVARLTGSDPTLRSEVVILGAHLDSVNMFGSSLNAPGADDNGSGSVAILEALRDIVQAGVVLKRTVEFHWYAAEEIGLRGSQAIAQEYKRQSVNVAAMLNLDVVSYYVSGINDIGVFTDNGNSQVQQFLRILTDGYLTFGRRDRTCGYGCSDHASWTQAGFPAAMASEVTAHPQMHTAQDNIENMNFTQLNEFIKLSIGFAIEAGEPSN